jgi:hydroxymethylpyrimidine/phosphomethylpyrimidine kinase
VSSPLVTLAIAGTDSGGAAGLAADLATFAALGTHGACVVTAVTAQDTTGVHDVHPVPLATIEGQLDAVLDDLPVAAVKTGMLGTPDVVRLLADRLATPPTRQGGSRPALVVDPVLVATSGASLARAGVVEAYRDSLLPVATVATPNRAEAVALLGHDGDPAELAVALTELCPAVVLTGGPEVVSTGSTTVNECTDWLAIRGSAPIPLSHAGVPTSNDHGTGCTFASALAVHLARGADLPTAASRAAAYTTRQLQLSSTWDLGAGRGPIAHVHQSVPAPKEITV